MIGKNCKRCDKKITKELNVVRSKLCKKCYSLHRIEIREAKKQLVSENFILENPNVREIEGYDGRYLISDEGNVYRVMERGIKKLKPGLAKKGYYQVCLFHNGKRKIEKIHRLVAFAFIPNKYPYLKKLINHKDGVKTNNHYTNLEWCTHKQNSMHAVKHGLTRVGEDVKLSKLTEQQVKEIYAYKDKFSQAKLSEMYGVSIKVISLIQKRKMWKHVKREKFKRRLLCSRSKKEEIIPQNFSEELDNVEN